MTATAGRDPTPAAPAMVAGGVHVAYGRVPVVHDISFAVQPGAYLGIVGANGAGKSTLLKAMAGLLPLRAGVVRHHGDDVSKLSAWRRHRRGLAFVPETRELFGALTVEENLRAGAMGAERTGRRERVERAYELFPILRDLADRPARLLSGGQQQTLAIARAVASGPSVLLLDEPSLGLSPIAVAQLVESLNELRAVGELAVVVAEQSLTVVRETCEQVLVLNLGREVAAGLATDVLTRSVIEEAFL